MTADTKKLRICKLEKGKASWELLVPPSFNDNLKKSASQGIQAAREGRKANVSPYMPQEYHDAYMDGYDTVTEALSVGTSVALVTDYALPRAIL
jgi:ribosome modulation factor